MIWALRKVIIAVGVAAFAWRILMDGIYGVTKALQLCNAIAKFSRGIMLAHQAAIHGTTIAIKAKTSADLAAAAGMKVYAVGAKIATAAQWLFNAAMAANPVGLVIAGIVLLVGIILVLTNKWKAVTDAVDGFFAKIRNMTGIGGAILQFLARPFEIAWKMIRSVFDIFAAFKEGGFLNGIKMIGLSILQFLVAPLQGVLNALSFLPGIGALSAKMNGWFESTRNNLLGIAQLTPTVAETGGDAAAKELARQRTAASAAFAAGTASATAAMELARQQSAARAGGLPRAEDGGAFAAGTASATAAMELARQQSAARAGGLPRAEDGGASSAAPTASSAQANSYSRSESITTNRLEVGLADGLVPKGGSYMGAPAFTLNTGRQ